MQHFRNLRNLIKEDYRRVFHTKTIWITLLAVALIPMIYAVLNIAVSWNPYSTSNTSRLPIAVVNNDEGSALKGKQFNIGKQITKQMKTNHAINWIITNDWQANDGLDRGKYYALIEIPSDFSAKIATFATENPQKPSVIYKSNEKLNPAATKITGQAKDTLTATIRSNFIKIGSKQALTMMNSAGETLSQKEPEILQLRSSLNDAIKTIDKTQANLASINKTSKETAATLQTVKTDVPKISSQIDDLQAVLDNGKAINESTRQLNTALQNNLSTGITSLQTQNNKLQRQLGALPTDGSASNSLIKAQTATSTTLINGIIDTINGNLRVLNVINNFVPTNKTTAMIKSLATTKQKLNKQKSQIASLRTMANSNSSAAKRKQLINQINATGDSVQTSVNNAYTNFNGITSPALDSLNSTINTNLTANSSVVQSMKSLLPGLKALSSAGNLSTSQVTRVSQRLDGIKSQLKELNNQMAFINKKNLNALVKLLGTDPKLSSLLSAPIKLQTEDIYNMKSFGEQVTPFYTSLALWIGDLLLTTLLSWEYILPDRRNGLHRPNHLESYLGKLTLFLGVSAVQATFTLVGEWLLGVRPPHVLAFFMTFYLVSFVFLIIMFNLVFMLGNAGKVVSVLLMLVQLFGTGGVYPLQVVPADLAALAPFLPFTYSIQMFREALTIPDWGVYWHDMLILLCIALFFTVIMPLRRLLAPIVYRMEDEMERAKL